MFDRSYLPMNWKVWKHKQIYLYTHIDIYIYTYIYMFIHRGYSRKRRICHQYIPRKDRRHESGTNPPQGWRRWRYAVAVGHQVGETSEFRQKKPTVMAIYSLYSHF